MDDKEILEEEEALGLRTLQDKAYALWEDLDRESRTGKIAQPGEAALLLRVVMALLQGENGTDRYVQTRLRSAVYGLGFNLQVIPKEQCGRGIVCPYHDHSDDVIGRLILQQQEARKRRIEKKE